MKYIRRNGSWTAIVSLPDRRQRRLTARTKAELDQLVTALKESIAKNTYASGGRITVADLSERWLSSVGPTLAAKTLQRYASIVKLHINPILGTKQIQKLRPYDLDEAISTWRNSPRRDLKKRKNAGKLTARTVAHIFQTLSIMLHFAVKRRLITVNPCASVDPPRPEHREMVSLDPKGVAKLFEVLHGTELEFAVVAAVGTGLRRGELLGLQWRDVDFENARLSVCRAWERVGLVSQYKEPKSVRSIRTISLPRFVGEALKAQRHEQSKRFIAAGLGRPTSGTPVFDRLDGPGEPYNPATFSTKYARLAKGAGIDATFHGLRHSFGSLSLVAGADLKTISAAMGHSAISVTANTYLHVAESLNRENADRLDGLMEAAIAKLTSEAS